MDTINYRIPADGMEFELTMSEIIDPMEMVRSAGYRPEYWEFRGAPTLIPRAAKFKLVRTSEPWCDICNLPSVLREHGFIPEGQWLEVLRRTYPINDHRGPIGIPNASWVRLCDDVYFPMLCGLGGEVWRLGFNPFRGSNYSFIWRWLVVSK